eukprot:TRINITY_DN1801_c0_g1_i1.p1 TRINITY_DN1801_c0_g1~~TRINITY_DN1801_c0_g1_i1.p1  ORF type:complete len:213 (+),score=46.37 TRINITY_DN1801_c0_g1_i1:516-1154(+)
MSAIVIGPGLGRDDIMKKTIADIIQESIKYDKPLIVDADALLVVTENTELIQGYQKAILTPNYYEYRRLCRAVLDLDIGSNEETPHENVKNLAASLGNVTIVRKGPTDIISNGESTIVCDTQGGKRRCGGQGDILAGTLGTYVGWAFSDLTDDEFDYPHTMLAAYAACFMTRTCSFNAFREKGRSLLAKDLLEEINPVFSHYFENSLDSPRD